MAKFTSDSFKIDSVNIFKKMYMPQSNSLIAVIIKTR